MEGTEGLWDRASRRSRWIGQSLDGSKVRSNVYQGAKGLLGLSNEM